MVEMPKIADPLSIDPNSIPEAIDAVRAVLDPDRGPLTPQEQTRGDIAAWVLARAYLQMFGYEGDEAAEVPDTSIIAETGVEECPVCGRIH